MEAPKDILDIIQNGYSVPFIDGILPPPAFAANNQSALRHGEFLLQELLRLERICCLERINYQPRIVLPCSVVFSNKWRLVTDASRHINPWIVKNKVKLDSLDTAEEVMLKGDFLSKQDLCSGYFHVLLKVDMRDNFGVHYVTPSGEVIFWRWRVLFLGERNAVWLFTKLLKPHRKFLAKNGIRNSLMIDDFLIMSRSFIKNLMDTQLHLWALESAGWVVRPEKCQNHPTREIKFLGLIMNSQKQAFFIPEEKKERIHKEIALIINADFMPVRQLASTYGLLISVYKAVGPLIRLLTRFGFECINKCVSWAQYAKISMKCKEELIFIAQHLDSLEGFKFSSCEKQIVVHSRTLASDASEHGLGVIEFTCEGKVLRLQHEFTEYEKSGSSTLRELIAFDKTYTEDFLEDVRGENILHCTDSYNVVRMFEIGSKRSIFIYLF